MHPRTMSHAPGTRDAPALAWPRRPRVPTRVRLALVLVVTVTATLAIQMHVDMAAPHKPVLVVSYRVVSTLLAHTRGTSSLTQQGSWFVRVRHGHAELVVQDARTRTERVYPLRMQVEGHR